MSVENQIGHFSHPKKIIAINRNITCNAIFQVAYEKYATCIFISHNATFFMSFEFLKFHLKHQNTKYFGNLQFYNIKQ